MLVTVSNWRQLADLLITTDELDPVYPFAVRLGEKEGRMFQTRFLTAFFMFYDLGGALDAAKASDDESFWDYIRANYAALPRGKERRHARGELGKQYVKNLSARGKPSQIWSKLYAPTYSELVLNIAHEFEGCGIGPYFTWKLMDLFDRVLGQPVRLNKAEVDRWLPPEPRKAIKLSGVSISDVCGYILNYPAPGLQNRKCGYSEAETILCAIKGFWFSKSYMIGDDLNRRHRELERHPEFIKLLPPNLEDTYVRGDFLGA